MNENNLTPQQRAVIFGLVSLLTLMKFRLSLAEQMDIENQIGLTKEAFPDLFEKEEKNG